MFGPDGDSFVGCLQADGVGQRDKSSVIASSYAYRQFVCLLFCIPTQDSIDAEENNEAVAPMSKTVDLLDDEDIAELSAVFDGIGDDKARTNAKYEFVDVMRVNGIRDIPASDRRRALTEAKRIAASAARPLPSPDGVDRETGELDIEVSDPPDTVKKPEVMALKPEGVSDKEWMDDFVAKAASLAPAAKPADQVTSWARLQRRPALVREVMGLVRSGEFYSDDVEPFDVAPADDQAGLKEQATLSV